MLSPDLPELSGAQAEALDGIHKSLMDHAITLLHGVTSSGKTEIYIHLADYVLRQGRQVLYLVPEIALTTQLTRRLQRVFGDRVVIYHSKFSDAERVEIWRRMLGSHEPCVVVGARSSIFLPFSGLGLVIVDEEHESSYKQFDPAPRYNARDASMVLASMHGAKVVLGSATPSVETYYKAESGRYGLVSLMERYGDVKLPEVEVVDMKLARKRLQVDGTFSMATVAAAREAFDRGEQVIFSITGVDMRRLQGARPVHLCLSVRIAMCRLHTIGTQTGLCAITVVVPHTRYPLYVRCAVSLRLRSWATGRSVLRMKWNVYSRAGGFCGWILIPHGARRHMVR